MLKERKSHVLQAYTRTGFDKVQAEVRQDGRPVKFTIWDTSGKKNVGKYFIYITVGTYLQDARSFFF